MVGWAGGWNDAHAVVWNAPEDKPSRLPRLVGGTFAQALDINNKGQVVGQSASDPTDVWESLQAVLWEKGVLIPLAPEYPLSWPGWHSLNERGQIVGTVLTTDGESHAVLWERKGKHIEMIDLNDQLAEPTSYLLIIANSINDRGWIVADAVDLDDPAHLNRAVLLVPRD